MTNKIIVDGWNLAWLVPEISKYIPDNLGQARAALNRMIKSYYQRKKVILKIIYDGQSGIIGPADSNNRVEVRFSKDPQKADHMIINLLRREKRPDGWTVITSDRELNLRAANIGAKVMTCEVFLSRIRSAPETPDDHTAKRNPDMSKDDMEYWLKLFEE